MKAGKRERGERRYSSTAEGEEGRSSVGIVAHWWWRERKFCYALVKKEEVGGDPSPTSEREAEAVEEDY